MAEQPTSVGVIAIIIKNKNSASKVNEIISQFNSLIIGRQGLPYSKRNLHIITLIIDASNDQINSLTGKIGQIKDVTVKSTLAKL